MSTSSIQLKDPYHEWYYQIIQRVSKESEKKEQIHFKSIMKARLHVVTSCILLLTISARDPFPWKLMAEGYLHFYFHLCQTVYHLQLLCYLTRLDQILFIQHQQSWQLTFKISKTLLQYFINLRVRKYGFKLWIASRKLHENWMHTFPGTLHASTRTNTQSALTAALRTFLIIMVSNLCIFFSITPGVS